ncbi:hypothetical protein BGZ94_002148, partial [Podila epigama]
MSKTPDHSTRPREKTPGTTHPSPRTPLRSNLNGLTQPLPQTPQSGGSSLGSAKGTPSKSYTSTPFTGSSPHDPPSAESTPGQRTPSLIHVHRTSLSNVDKTLHENISTLESSVKHHIELANKLKADIDAKKQEAETEQSQFEDRMEELREALQDVKLKTKQSHHRILTNNEELQRRRDLILKQEEGLMAKNRKAEELHERMITMEQEKEQIRELQRETDGPKIEELKASKERAQKELADCYALLQENVEYSAQLEKTYRPEEIERLRGVFAEREAQVIELEKALAEKKMITQRDPEDLLIVSRLAAERKIKALQEEYDQERKHAVDNERLKEEETEMALEEYILKNQTAVEIEEETSQEEYNLLKDREELDKLQESQRRQGSSQQQSR